MSRSADQDDLLPDGTDRAPPLSWLSDPMLAEELTGTQSPGSAASSSVADLSAPGLGAQLPDFELLEVLGRGGMGIVYKARQKSLDRLVAVKMLLNERSCNAAALARFLTEARAAAGLDHPNIVGVHQIGECSLGHFFAMEFIEGQTLQELLDKQFCDKSVPITRAANLMIAVAEAVAYAHGKGIIHGDLKPGNIMIDKFKRPVVMDFGIAKLAKEQANLTDKGVIPGTPAYMPPEQTGECPGEVGPESDVYALGAILYRLLTGRPVYEAETALRTILLVAGPEMPLPVRQLRPEVPVSLNLICMKCLNKRPGERYANAGALAQELRGCRAVLPPSSSGMHRVLAPVMLVAASGGKAIPLSGSTTVIGRASECQVILKSAEISKRHCRIMIQGDRATIEDLDSVNGTILNGFPIQSAFLKDGDVLELGDHSFSVRLNKPLR